MAVASVISIAASTDSLIRFIIIVYNLCQRRTFKTVVGALIRNRMVVESPMNLPQEVGLLKFGIA
mgnify:FL=1